MKLYNEIFHEDLSQFKLEEAKADESILARITGPYFVPNGTSRNKRYYSQELWNKALSNPAIKERIKNKNLFGFIGHYDEDQKIDTLIGEGKSSHFMESLSPNGTGTAAILDTPAGRVLHTLYKAGCVLYSSSRANGQYKEGSNRKGIPEIDPETYQLEGFDFVTNPGFLQAKPELMSNESLLEDLNKLGIKPQRLEESVAIKALGKMSETYNEMLDKHQELLDELTQYTKFGTPEEIKKYIETSGEEVLEELNELRIEVASYRTLGTFEEIAEALDRAKNELLRYQELGSPDEINKALDYAAKLARRFKANQLATEKDISVEEALELVEKGLNEDDISKFIESFKPDETERFVHKGSTTEGEPQNRIHRLLD